MNYLFVTFIILLSLRSTLSFNSFNGNNVILSKQRVIRNGLTMEVKNDATARANRETRKAGADDRAVELKKPMGLVLDEDKQGNVFVVSIDPNGRADKSGKVFVGDQVKMVSATFGDDLWSCEGVGLTRVLSCIKVRNTKPVTLVLEATNEQEEKKRRAIAYREPTAAEKEATRLNDAKLLEAMVNDDESLKKKRKGLFGLW